MSNKQPNTEEQLVKFLEKEKKLTKPKKTFTIMGLSGVSLFLTVFLIFFPFKDGSVFELMLLDFKNNTWNSATIFQIILQISVWAFLIWKLTTRIQETVLYYKKRKLFNFEVLTKSAMNLHTQGGIVPNILKTKDKDKYINFVVNGILDAFIKDSDPLSSNCSLEIKTIIEDETITRKQKIQKIKECIEREGHKIDNTQKVKSIKQV
ncbi:Hypothetical protein, predicted transmembrane protein [Mycoplasmopsis bovigenitalium 51080]|uniref:Uncharacterized protein n=1 Tax=Mycoplasmopsis bovigenitalium 51080 TaxID=1188235 RepID=N9VBD6_9BACT|nr:hypothetical protein [Mycoplasmopsis bovigenitalium]ENY69008.1 Hypothetical protein, predicted transmembrane protein [Mycoplasmopsis bovigenitalium 51080]